MLERIRTEVTAMLRTLHIEDDPLWREVVAKLLGETQDVLYVGAADSASSGIQMCAELKPDLVVLDLFLPDDTGFDTMRRLTAMRSALAVAHRAVG